MDTSRAHPMIDRASLAILLPLLLCGVMVAGCDSGHFKWIQVSDNDNPDVVEMDVANVREVDGIRRVWVREKYSTPHNSSRGPIRMVMAVYEVDCRRQTFRPVDRYSYKDADDTGSVSQQHPDPAHNPTIVPVPGSIGEGIVKRTCEMKLP
jgi:hypothetical protein